MRKLPVLVALVAGLATALTIAPAASAAQTATQTFSLAAGTAIPVTGGSGSCQILHLELGPLDLDLLGLKVHLDKVVLDITAQPGPGNLLGNLLCSLANALKGG